MESDPTSEPVHGAHISIVADGTTRIVACDGELDLASYQECGTALIADVELAIVLDLSATTFMDCAGYRAIAGCRRHIRGGQRSLAVRGAVGEPAHLLQLIEEAQRHPTKSMRLATRGRPE